MTPLEKAQDILKEVVTLADSSGISLPSRQYALIGEPVVECDSVIVTLDSLAPPADMPTVCGVPQLGTFSVIIARDCAFAVATDGTTIVDQAVKVAEQQSDDGELLWEYANTAAATAWLTPRWDLGFVTIGGLAITSLSLDTGIN